MKPSIAIIGGGISGLGVAYELSRRGHNDFVLYEGSPRLGGIVETHRQDGFIIECGPDSWVTEKPWARELAIELGLEAEILTSNDAHRRTYLLEDNQLIPIPDGMRMMVPTDLDAIDRSPLFSAAAKKAYRAEPARAEELTAFAAARSPNPSADQDESVASFVQRHFGREVAETVAAPLLAGVFGGDIRQLSAAAVMAPFLKMEREQGSLILALQEKKRGAAADSSVFTTLRSGLQPLIDGMAAAVPRFAFHLAQPVLSIAPAAQGWKVTTATEAAGFERVVLATPVHVSRELTARWNPGLSSLLKIDATSAVIAAFAFDARQSSSLIIPEGFGFLVPQRSEDQSATFRRQSKEPELLAATFVNQKFAHRAPEGCTLLRAFFGGDAAPSLFAKSDEFILTLARRHLERVLGPLPEAHIALVRRWPHSLPQYTVGHLARVAAIEAALRDLPGLHLVGNAFHGVGLPDLVRQARFAAAELLSA